jgi:hypothetical protein
LHDPGRDSGLVQKKGRQVEVSAWRCVRATINHTEKQAMSERMSRDEFDAMSGADKNRFIASGGTVYDGKEPPGIRTPEKPKYLISRKLYNSLSAGQEWRLCETYTVRIVE